MIGRTTNCKIGIITIIANKIDESRVGFDSEIVNPRFVNVEIA